MKFDDILKYQSTDIKLRRVYDEIEKSELNKQLEATRSKFNAAKANVEECKSIADALISSIGSAEQAYADEVAKLADLTKKADNAGEDEGLDEVISRLEAVRNTIGELDKRLVDIKNKADKALKTYIESNNQGVELRRKYSDIKQKLDEFKKQKEPDILVLKKELAALKASIEPAVMEQYNALVGEGKIFAFVEAVKVDKDYSCRGCGISLSQTLKSELEEKGWCRCETCRRFIYMPESRPSKKK